MKSKSIICLLLIIFMFFAFSINSYASTALQLNITSNNYAIGDELSADVKVVEIEKDLQLYAVLITGEETGDDTRRIVKDTNLGGVIWTSSDEDIATVDDMGKVTAHAEGWVTITAVSEDSPNIASYSLKITDSTNKLSRKETRSRNFIIISIGVIVCLLIAIVVFIKHKKTC